MTKMRCYNKILAISLLGFILSSGAAIAQMNTWSRKADMQFGRSFPSVASVNGKIYVMGGTFGNGEAACALVEEYDPVTNTWTRKADMPAARQYAPVAVLNGKIYVFGGWLYRTMKPWARSQIDVYNPSTDTWTTEGNMPIGKGMMIVAVVNGKVYIIGGIDEDNKPISTVDEYDLNTGIWARKADTLTPKGSQNCGDSSLAINGKIYVIDEDTALSLEEYNPMTDTWTRKADIPTPRYGLAIAQVNGKIFVIGGGLSGTQGFIPTGTVEMYDPATDTWTKKPDMPTPVGWASATVIGANIYVAGGFYFSDLNTLYVYDTGLGMEVKTISLQEGYVTGGEQLTIFGSAFLPDLIVTIGDKPLSDMKVTDTFITGVTPPGTEGEQEIRFHVPSQNYSSVAGKFFYKPISVVTVTRIMPNSGKQAGGDVVSITGSGFLPGATVTVGGVPGTDVGVTPTLITFKVPPETEGTKDVVVTNPDGQRGILRSAYTYNPFPVIDKIRPSAGGPLSGGTEITITGSSFMAGLTVYIGDARVTLDRFSSTELHLKSPSSSTHGMKPIRVVNPDGQVVIAAEGFRYNNPPDIKSIEPSAGALEGGTWVRIKGRDFDAPDVYFGEVRGYTQSSDSETITVETPPSTAGAKDVTVENRDGQKDTIKNAFTYNPAPVITSITPDNGKLTGGTGITIAGGGFLPKAKVCIGTMGQGGLLTIVYTLYSEYISPTQIKSVMPPSDEAKSVNIVVINSDEQRAILEDGFRYNAVPTIAGIEPNHGRTSGGTRILIKGTGFMDGARVQIGANMAESPKFIDENTIEAITPLGRSGRSVVVVINPDMQTVFKPDGFIYVGMVAYNYPTPFKPSQVTTFRYVSDDKLSSMKVRIFNTAGIPIDVVYGEGTNEVRWQNPSLRRGIYVYVMEVVMQNGKKGAYRGVLEVYE